MIDTNTNISETITEAVKLYNSGEFSSAKRIISDLPFDSITDPDALMEISTISTKIGLNNKVIQHLSKLIEIHPNNANYHLALAEAYFTSSVQQHDQLSLLIKCREILLHVISLNPKYANAFIKLARVESLIGNSEESVRLLTQALTIQPNDINLHLSATAELRLQNRHDEALKLIKKFTGNHPDIAEGHQSLGRTLIEMGRTREAIQSLEKAIKLNNLFGQAYWDLSSVKKFTHEDYPLIKRIESNLQQSIPHHHRYLMHFSLGKIYDDCKDADKAFEHYRMGNLLDKKPNEPLEIYALFKKIKGGYTKTFMDKLRIHGCPSKMPIFIVGMPRSGTTLIEQIISSHPAGGGAGELCDIDMIDDKISPRQQKNNYTSKLQKILTSETIIDYANQYLDALRKNCDKDALRIVDKMPGNFIHLGLISALFPNATIIHAIRNPLDTCLSCYFQPFATQYWSNDLKWIANFYHFYRETMEHWKAILPKERILNIHYESLISDPVDTTKRLISGCSLEWDDKCLEFYNENRTINTASLWQARQPIYSSSQKRWVRYAPYIKELAQSLSKYLDEEDIEELAKHGIKIKSGWRFW